MKTDIVTVQGQRYQLRKLQADVGSFIYMKMMGALLTGGATQEVAEQTEEDKEQQKNTPPRIKARMLCSLAFMRGLSYEHMQFAQKQAMMVVSRLEDGPSGDLPMPLMTDSGKWVPSQRYGAIEEEGGLVQKLVLESLAFSLESFFSESSVT